MDQTPVHEEHNPQLLASMPPDARHVIEVGCSAGALAREYRRINPVVRYVGVEIDARYAELAARHCSEVVTGDIERLLSEGEPALSGADCWVFGDTLEHLHDPWAVLNAVRRRLPDHGCVVACVPNAQHWSMQARLNAGHFRYQRSGLMDITHLRFFTRQTLIELFEFSGFRIISAMPRIFRDPRADALMPALRGLAQAQGLDPEQAERDAWPYQYVLRALVRR